MNRFLTFLLFLTTPAALLAQGPVQPGHGEDCNIDQGKICPAGLTCQYSKCSCQTGQGFEWDPVQMKCVGREGTPCGSSADCASNSNCLDMFCRCNAGFSRNKGGHCGRVNGQACTINEDCNEDALLHCNAQKVCSCLDDRSYDWVSSSGYCGSLIGNGCDPHHDFYGFPNGPTRSKCADTLVCQQQNTDTYTCKCQPGFEAMDNGKCRGIPGGARGTTVSLFIFLICTTFGIILKM